MICLGLGSNAADTRGHIKCALRTLSQQFDVVKISALYTSPAWPDAQDTPYINCAVLIETAMCPADIMAQLHAIEADMGRNRDVRWGKRTIDLDILAYNDLVLPDINTWHKQADLSICEMRACKTPPLTIPHPRLCIRAFALLPLQEIWPDWIHPIYQQSGKELQKRVPSEQLETLDFLCQTV